MMVEYKDGEVRVLLIFTEPDTFLKEHALVKMLDIVSDVQKSYTQFCKEQDEKST